MRSKLVLAAALCAIAAGPTWAHHSYAMFEQDREVTMEGTVTKFEFINPHSWIYVSSPNQAGVMEEWVLELGSPGQLSRRGWKRNSLKAGDKIVMKFNPMKEGHPPLKAGLKGGNFRSATTMDGRAIPLRADG